MCEPTGELYAGFWGGGWGGGWVAGANEKVRGVRSPPPDERANLSFVSSPLDTGMVPERGP
ncbi:hypothetical protein amyaer_p04815 (plasmid) [Microcystis aeruginosa NIES-2481]|nr:hypothetical protein amyaer_p04815 [Microcystis aeruginosa NIES-2481]